MTSEERHEARYKRRKARRDSKRKKVLETYGNYYKVISRDVCRGPPNKPLKG